MKRNTLVPSPIASAIHSAHVKKGLGNNLNSLNSTVPTSPPGGPQSEGIPHVVCDIVFIFIALKIAPAWITLGFPMLGIEHYKGKCKLFYCCWALPNIGIQNLNMWGMYDLAKAYRSIQNPLPNRRVEDWEASNGHTKDTAWLFHSPLHNAHGRTHLCTVI